MAKITVLYIGFAAFFLELFVTGDCCKYSCELQGRNLVTDLTLPLPSLLVPTPFAKGGGGGRGVKTTPSYLKNRCLHEREILQGIRDTFESLRNVKVVYIVFTWLP